MFRTSLRQFSRSTKLLAEYKRKENPSYNELAARIDPIVRTGETIEVKRARLMYQSRKRGILESDLLLSRFAKKYLHKLTYEELDEYDKLLDEPDWDIYYWATQNYDVTPLPEQWKNLKILKMLQEDAQNPGKEILRMPDLH
uniref:Succinate dehydrogenase assembly factor 2, mitochondrial n=1 Tax=Candidozyma auris TaxID=498019 RepID=A0A0L0P325_CANAR